MKIEDFMPKQPAQFDRDLTRDYKVALAAAKDAEDQVGKVICHSIDEMCDTPGQKNIASALITAMMIGKFEHSRDVVGPQFRQAVDKLREHFEPTIAEVAKAHYAGNHTRWERLKHAFLRLYNDSPVMYFLVLCGLGSLGADIVQLVWVLVS